MTLTSNYLFQLFTVCDTNKLFSVLQMVDPSPTVSASDREG